MARRTSYAGACAVACALAVAPAPVAGFLAAPLARIGAARSETEISDDGRGCLFMRVMRPGRVA